jgi:hypothetical protein
MDGTLDKSKESKSSVPSISIDVLGLCNIVKV